MNELPHELPNDLRCKIVGCTEMNFSFNDFFSKCEQISHLPKKPFLTENFHFCALISSGKIQKEDFSVFYFPVFRPNKDHPLNTYATLLEKLA